MEADLPDLCDVPAIPIHCEFSVLAFEWTWSPHPYMVSDAHVKFAAVRSRRLDDNLIRDAEMQGAHCAFCDKSFDEHRKVIGMVIRPEVPDKVPNFLEGFTDWLNQNEYVLRNELKVEVLLFAKYEPRIVRNI